MQYLQVNLVPWFPGNHAAWFPGCKLLGMCLLLTSLATFPLSFLSQRSCHTGLLSVFLRLQVLFCLLAFVFGESSGAFCCSLPDWHLSFKSQPEYLYPERPSALFIYLFIYFAVNILAFYFKKKKKAFFFVIPLRGLLEPQPKAVTHLSLSPSTLYFIAFISYVSESAM